MHLGAGCETTLGVMLHGVLVLGRGVHEGEDRGRMGLSSAPRGTKPTFPILFYPARRVERLFLSICLELRLTRGRPRRRFLRIHTHAETSHLFFGAGCWSSPALLAFIPRAQDFHLAVTCRCHSSLCPDRPPTSSRGSRASCAGPSPSRPESTCSNLVFDRTTPNMATYRR